MIIQRVKSASVTVDEELISSIGKGLLVLAGVGKEDSEKEAENVVNKILKAKFWPDENGSQVRLFYGLLYQQVLTVNSSGRRMYWISREKCYVVSDGSFCSTNGYRF